MEGEIVGWYHLFNGHEFEQTQGDGVKQGSLVDCSSWGHRFRHDRANQQLSLSIILK